MPVELEEGPKLGSRAALHACLGRLLSLPDRRLLQHEDTPVHEEDQTDQAQSKTDAPHPCKSAMNLGLHACINLLSTGLRGNHQPKEN